MYMCLDLHLYLPMYVFFSNVRSLYSARVLVVLSHFLIHSFIHSFSQYLISINYMLASVLSTEHTEGNQTTKVFVLTELIF